MNIRNLTLPVTATMQAVADILKHLRALQDTEGMQVFATVSHGIPSPVSPDAGPPDDTVVPACYVSLDQHRAEATAVPLLFSPVHGVLSLYLLWYDLEEGPPAPDEFRIAFTEYVAASLQYIETPDTTDTEPGWWGWTAGGWTAEIDYENIWRRVISGPVVQLPRGWYGARIDVSIQTHQLSNSFEGEA